MIINWSRSNSIQSRSNNIQSRSNSIRSRSNSIQIQLDCIWKWLNIIKVDQMSIEVTWISIKFDRKTIKSNGIYIFFYFDLLWLTSPGLNYSLKFFDSECTILSFVMNRGKRRWKSFVLVFFSFLIQNFKMHNKSLPQLSAQISFVATRKFLCCEAFNSWNIWLVYI